MKLCMFAVAAALFFSSIPGARAQQIASGSATGGYVTWAFNAEFEQPLYNAGVGEIFSPYLTYNNGNQAFHITGGLLDLSTGAGEIGTEGGFVVVKGNTVFEIRRMVIDTTGTTPVITGMLYNNQVNYGRVAVFNLLNVPYSSLSLGTLSTGTYVTLTTQARKMLQLDFGVPIAASTVVASFQIDTTLSADTGPQ